LRIKRKNKKWKKKGRKGRGIFDFKSLNYYYYFLKGSS
jgi:hypothetical protein